MQSRVSCLQLVDGMEKTIAFMLNVGRKESNSDRKSYDGPKPLCSKAQGHFRRNCPKLKNNDRGDQAGNDRAPTKVYVVGNAGENPDNVVCGVAIKLLNPFNINLIPVELGSFDAIISMDWLAKYQAVIVCAEKIVASLWEMNLIIMKYMEKGFPIFLAHVTAKEVEDKSEKKRLEDVPIVRDFPKIFPEDLPGLPSDSKTCQGSSVYSKIDLSSGLTISSPTRIHGNLMNRVCKPYPDKFVIVFIDDILIYSKNKQEHEEHLKLILELLKKEELHAKFSKCEFWIPKVQFLGYVIDSEGIHMDPAKIESIKDWTSPKSPTKIRQFLGLVGYYRRFIEGFSKIAKPMTKLTQKKVKFEWGDKQDAAFQQLKQKLYSMLHPCN
ncbi:putative reverse transcriptase domain-containing protein [Tanacetum coccineum]